MEKIFPKRNYSDIVYDINYLRDLGFADGYADLASDVENIAIYSYKLMESREFTFECMKGYMEGYDVGLTMSQNSPDIYDEDGILKDGIDIQPDIFDYDVQYVMQKIFK
ncbi:MAG: hypothetical protein PHX04_00150 [Bacilli bacterium]|nr:hypothetical protein [Bacilli bacterium]